MTVTLELKPEVEARLRARAAERGLPLKKFLEAVIEIDVGRGGVRPFHETASAEEWEEALRDWVNRDRPPHPPLSEEAISRENIYREREDSQL
jgi:predicted transcriptional regulator